MKLSLVALALVAAAAAAGLTSLAARTHAAPATATASDARLYSPPRVLVHYGHIRSLVKKESRYEMRFDPASWLGGTTANRAAVEDKVIGPGETVPNDYYIRDETHRLLTYFVPTWAKVTVVTNSSAGLRSTPIAVAELAQIVKGKNPKKRKLLGRGLGYWIRVATETVRSLDQQYQP